MENFDFIAIGDTTTDAFIKIKQASVYKDGGGEEKLCVENGAKIPYESVTVVPAVGNSPNAAVAARRLGLHSALVTNIGDDVYGKEDLETLKKNGVDTRFVKVHTGKPSNYHFVLWFHAERTILIKHTEYSYELPDIGKPKWIYLSSLGENSLEYHHKISGFLKKNPDIKLAFQPGTFQIKLGYEELKELYEMSELFFCNKEEARIILKTAEEDAAKLAEMMRERGPKIAVITNGPNGAYAANGSATWHIPMYPDPAPPVDRTGAGDAFASTVTSYTALGMSIDEALLRGPINSMSVVQYVGAQEGLLSREKLEALLKEAPREYRAEKIG
ncbi:MAG: carbohydrate kinase family protein [Candidatus Lloydbacteria bacterium]|nr:carbohydrate kinase family protein [Candidatus Lloydbacteria bacterium]